MEATDRNANLTLFTLDLEDSEDEDRNEGGGATEAPPPPPPPPPATVTALPLPQEAGVRTEQFVLRATISWQRLRADAASGDDGRDVDNSPIVFAVDLSGSMTEHSSDLLRATEQICKDAEGVTGRIYLVLFGSNARLFDAGTPGIIEQLRVNVHAYDVRHTGGGEGLARAQ